MDDASRWGSARAQSWGAALLTVAFLSPWVPCLLHGGLLSGEHLASAPFAAFATWLPVGCLASATAMLLVRLLRVEQGPSRRAILLAAGASVAGYALLAVALLLPSEELAVAAGAVAGAAVVPLGIVWCAQTKVVDFSSMLFRGALIGLGVFLVTRIAALLPVGGCAALWLLCSAAVGAWVAQHGGRGRPKEGEGDDVRAGAEAPLGPLSARGAFSVIATAAIGLVPFVLLSNISPGVTVENFTFDSSTGLLVGSLLTLAIAAWARCEKPIAPTLFWTVFPVCAGVLVVLVSFPKETFVSTLSAGLAFAFFSMIGVFAVVCCAHAVAQREFPAALVVAPPFALAAAASVTAGLLADIQASSEEAGAALMVVAMAYFVCLMLAPAFQLRRLRQAMVSDGGAEGAEGASRLAFDEACELLAAQRSLSKREREVFGYLVKGYTSPYIAKALFISDSTVRSHTKSIYRKFEVSSRTDLIEIVRSLAADGS